MIYVTIPLKYIPRQLTWEMVIKNIEIVDKGNTYDTRTFCRESITGFKPAAYNEIFVINALKRFNESTAFMQKDDMQELYSSYSIRKKSGGYRRIDNPCSDLKQAQNRLKDIFEDFFLARYHTCAYAYIPKRNIVMCRQKHAANHSKWFLYTDFSNFFGSITYEYVIKMLSQIFPFNSILANPTGNAELKKALKLCFLNGGLPQGSPISPMLTNLIMIPIDYQINKYVCQNFKRASYTRYADDICISSIDGFDYKEVISHINEILKSEGAPFGFNDKKTHYMNNNWKNFNLGIMINKDGNMTIGWRKKKELKTLLHSFIMSHDDSNKCIWELRDVQYLQGIIAYYKQIEPQGIANIIDLYNKKFHCNIQWQIKQALKI